MKRMPFKKIEITIFGFVMLIITILMLIANNISLIFAESDSTRSVYIFNILESTLMIALIIIPAIFTKVSRYEIPPIMEIMYIIFCTGCIILGEIGDFYAKISWWDSMLHLSSGVLFGILGYIIINTMNRFDGKTSKFSPIFVSFWVVCFSLAMAAIWELFEFTVDEIFGTNMQQYLVNGSMLSKEEPLLGHDALRDTIKDLALDFVGSIIPAIIGYIGLKKNKMGFTTIYLKKISSTNKEVLPVKDNIEHINNPENIDILENQKDSD